jgi:predicted nucleic acid-binding protein
MTRFLETDAILRYLTGDDHDRATAVLELLHRVESGRERVVTSPMVIFEVVFTLQSFYGVPRAGIREMVGTILELRGLSLDGREVFIGALDLYCELNLPFADAFNACYMKRRGLAEIYTFDRDYDRVRGLKRVEPA